MKIIEAMKALKALNVKIEDLKKKVAGHSADLDIETPVYADQTQQLREWMQSYTDSLKEMARLKLAIQRTNIGTQVDIELDGKKISKSIAEWVYRRRSLVDLEKQLYSSLTDRNLREGAIPSSNPNSGESRPVKIRRYYDPKVRDGKLSGLGQEPFLIDARLEVVNAITDLIE